MRPDRRSDNGNTALRLTAQRAVPPGAPTRKQPHRRAATALFAGEAVAAGG